MEVKLMGHITKALRVSRARKNLDKHDKVKERLHRFLNTELSGRDYCPFTYTYTNHANYSTCKRYCIPSFPEIDNHRGKTIITCPCQINSEYVMNILNLVLFYKEDLALLDLMEREMRHPEDIRVYYFNDNIDEFKEWFKKNYDNNLIYVCDKDGNMKYFDNSNFFLLRESYLRIVPENLKEDIKIKKEELRILYEKKREEEAIKEKERIENHRKTLIDRLVSCIKRDKNVRISELRMITGDKYLFEWLKENTKTKDFILIKRDNDTRDYKFSDDHDEKIIEKISKDMYVLYVETPQWKKVIIDRYKELNEANKGIDPEYLELTQVMKVLNLLG